MLRSQNYDPEMVTPRIAQPEDNASVAVFLATEDSRHMTGQTLHVNGGVYMR